jgi:hypothetical protein
MAAFELKPGSVRGLALPALLALACGQADGSGARAGSALVAGAAGAAGSAGVDASSDTGAAASGGAGGAPDGGTLPSNDEGPCEGGACDECPAPAPKNCSAERDASWSRNPVTGGCCPYYRVCQAPEDWAQFSTREECESSCRCRDVTPNDFSMVDTLGVVTLATERTTMECWCGDGNVCRERTFSEAATNACADGVSSSLSQVVGCGMIVIRHFGGFTGSDDVFDAATGALIGEKHFSDTTRGPCRTYETIIGIEFACAAAVECALCDGTRPLLDGCQ